MSIFSEHTDELQEEIFDLKAELAAAIRRLDEVVNAARDLRRAQRAYIGRPALTTTEERELLGQKVDAAARALDKAMEPLT